MYFIINGGDCQGFFSTCTRIARISLKRKLHLAAQVEHSGRSAADGQQQKQGLGKLPHEPPCAGGVKRLPEGTALDLPADLQRRRPEQAQAPGGQCCRDTGSDAISGQRFPVQIRKQLEGKHPGPGPVEHHKEKDGQRTDGGESQQKQDDQCAGCSQEFGAEQADDLGGGIRRKGSAPTVEVIPQRF